MRLSFREPWSGMMDHVGQLQREMNRLFDRWTPSNGREWTRASAYPAFDVWEDADMLHLEAELPGVELKDLEIYVTGGNQLTVKGERKQPMPGKGVWHRQERGFGTFVRTLTLPFAVNAEKVEAKLDNGILQIDLAKHESAKPRKITVKAE